MSYSVMGPIVLVLLVVALVAGCGPASDRAAGDVPVVSIPPSDVRTKILSASPEQEKVLLEILAGLGPTPLETVEVDASPEEGWGSEPNAVALLQRGPRRARLFAWHAWLVAHAFEWRSHELGLPPLAYFSGGLATISAGGVREADRQAMSLDEARALVSNLRQSVARRGVEVRRIEVLEPRRYAFFVELVADDPAEFLLNHLDSALAPLTRARGYDGDFVRLIDREGRPALESFGAGSGGGGWIRPDLAGCYQISISAPQGYTAPPCPADDSDG
jgi:hypothetical protein